MNIKGSITAAIIVIYIIACSSRPAREMKSDSYLDDKVTADRVENTLHHRAAAFAKIHAASTNGVVYLTGTVATLRQRQMADQVAHQIDGVIAVKNQISLW